MFGDCPAWVEKQLLERHYDLHLLLSPEGIDWIADGQRCQQELELRQAFFLDSQRWFQAHQQPYEIISGDWINRREQAFSLLFGDCSPASSCTRVFTPNPSTNLVFVQESVKRRTRYAQHLGRNAEVVAVSG